jgi:HrpA-like RNA helicase
MVQYFISEYGSKRRAATAGKTRPGKCFRLYQKNFAPSDPTMLPEILRYLKIP